MIDRDRSRESNSQDIRPPTGESLSSVAAPIPSGELIPPLLSGAPSLHRAKSAASSPARIIEDIHREIPAGIELHRVYHYQVPLPKRSRLDVIILKVYAPEEMDGKLNEWRRSIDDRYSMVTVLIRRVSVEQNIQNHLTSKFRGSPLLDKTALPTLDEMIGVLCGSQPASTKVTRLRTVKREDLTSIPFVAIDRPGTLDMEDLLHAERKQNGSLVFRAAYIDATDHVHPGSTTDKYALRVGSTMYGRSRTISTLGATLSHGLVSFQEGTRRPAWVVEGTLTPHAVKSTSNHKHIEYSLRFKLRSAIVTNKRGIDPEQPLDTASDNEISRSLSALSEVAHILEARRNSRPALVRVGGENAASKIVAEIMIESKRFLANFLGTRHRVPTIYRVHHKPSKDVVESFLSRLDSLKIPAAISDFETPSQFAGILQSLESKGTPECQSLLNTLIDTYLLRSQYSTKNEGHFGLRLDAYLEIKPRDASGLANQFQLAAITEGREPLSENEMLRRAVVLNDKRWKRDETHFKLRFLEMLQERLNSVDMMFLGTLAYLGKNATYIEVPGFSKWGVLQEPHNCDTLTLGAPVAAVLKGFDLNQMRFLFEIAR